MIMPTTMNPSRIFLSGASGDFSQVRQTLRGALARGGCEVIHQEDFPQTQAKTVLKLAQLIERCGVLIHLVGRNPGSVADAAAVREYLAEADQGGAFLAAHPDLRAALGDFSGITYTQWELLIALHLGCSLLVYGDATHGESGHPQRLHLDRLIGVGRHATAYADEPDLCCKVMADLMAHFRQTLPASQVERLEGPSNLPGGYIGRLFLGRETFLDQIRTSLWRQGGGEGTGLGATAITQKTAATGIAGLGGIGKTHAAVEYAHRHEGQYSARLFVRGDSPEKLQTSLAELCSVLQLDARPGGLPPGESARAALAIQWLKNHPGWLLIVDNVDDEPAAQALTDLLGSLTAGHVLITSRLHGWADNVEPLDIEVLCEDDSTDLLLQLTEQSRRKTADDSAQARRLAALLAGLPLALHQAAGYIRKHRLTLAGYITEYEQEAQTLLGWFDALTIPYERPDKLAPRPVLITWKTSFDKLDAKTRVWLLVFAHFAADPIPEFLLKTPADADNGLKSLYREARQALAQAETYCLITRLDEPPRFKVHRLVQQIIRLTAKPGDIATALDWGIRLFDAAKLGDPQDVRFWSKWTPLQPHAAALCNYAPDEPAPERLSWLLGELDALYHSKGLFIQAEVCSRRALKIDESSYGPEHTKVAVRLNNLAALLQATNRLSEAEPLMRRGLDIERKSKGEDHPHVAIQLNNLAQLLKETNRLSEAEPLMRRSLEIVMKSYGKDHSQVAVQLSNLAVLLVATNRISEAEPLMRRALSIVESSYGPNHPNVANRLCNLASLLMEADRLSEAEPLIRRALEINESSYGAEHPSVAWNLNNLAALLKETNRLSEAEPLMRQGLEIEIKSKGKDHPHVAIQLSNLALLLQETNRLSEAESLMRRALEIDEKSYGLNHSKLAIRLNNLSLLLQETGQPREAEPLMKRALVIFIASLGAGHPDSQTVGSNYISLLQIMGLSESEVHAKVNAVLRGE